jgi:hypothetical protein
MPQLSIRQALNIIRNSLGFWSWPRYFKSSDLAEQQACFCRRFWFCSTFTFHAWIVPCYCQENSKFYIFVLKQRIISLRHSSILWRIWLNFMALCLVFIRRLFQFSYFFPSDFQLFWPEYHWRDLSSRNAHLVHQNW